VTTAFQPDGFQSNAFQEHGGSLSGGIGYSLSGAAGSYVLTGQDGAFNVTRALAGSAGTYSLSGQDGTFSYVAGTHHDYTLAGDAGAYVITGQPATFAKTGTALFSGGLISTGGERRRRKKLEDDEDQTPQVSEPPKVPEAVKPPERRRITVSDLIRKSPSSDELLADVYAVNAAVKADKAAKSAAIKARQRQEDEELLMMY
jgi:hypothetical protein